MKEHIRTLLAFFSVDNARCKFQYGKGKQFCILGAMSYLFPPQVEHDVKIFLEERLLTFVANNNKSLQKANANFIKIEGNLNLATFNDGSSDQTFVKFLTEAYHAL